ncbi:hypothetical protein [Burkholderia lata]|uniref:hypothetical protein n=1 Tax=Burkholderia lata (strain ATCC 17760 / DSM 23089 / LMG 22485 / NCIMB 9086 / R18194 / 383) TaxID=482957 RepID=UPI0015834361|nr:hypothetical protein [Burkholderia lata]
MTRLPVTAGARNAARNKRLLPKDFDRLLADEDLANLRAIFDTRDVNARAGSSSKARTLPRPTLKATRRCTFAPAIVALGYALPRCARQIVASRAPGSSASVARRSSRQPIVSLSPGGNHMPAALLPTP